MWQTANWSTEARMEVTGCFQTMTRLKKVRWFESNRGRERRWQDKEAGVRCSGYGLSPSGTENGVEMELINILLIRFEQLRASTLHRQP